jgi:C-terminal processing protease CtpA/Prc
MKRLPSIVLDLRGYPRGYALESIRVLMGSKNPVDTSVQRVPYLGENGAQIPEYTGSQSTIGSNESDPYLGDLFVLIDEDTISQSEQICLELRAIAHHVTFIGSKTVGTNGNVTQMVLPGRYFISFTGMGVWHTDGSQFQRLGIVPDVAISPTIKGLRAGRDEVLERAVKVASHTRHQNRTSR